MLFYFFGLVPIIYFLNQYLDVNLRNFGVETLVILVFLADLYLIWKKLKWDKVLITVLILFGLMHITFYHFYGMMPESDGYTDLLRMESMAKSGMVVSSHNRPFFYTALAELTILTKINPYVIYTTWMIALSANVILILNLVVNELKIKGWKKLLILMSAMAFPVLNMEIDFFRPQSLYLIFFPVWFYLIYKKRYCWAGLLALVGLGYHQFFIFPLAATIGILAWKYFPKWIIGAGVAVVVLFGLWKYWGMFGWQWWFLDDYSTYPDNVQMGWPGVKGTLMFYGYYYGPMFLAAIFLILKKSKSLIDWILILMLVTFLSISEIVPRILFPYLPERFALLSDLVVLFSLPFLIEKVKINKKIICFWFAMVLIGIGASVYIARSKGSLTSRNEVEAATWINNNTPVDAVFYTQKSNETMMDYFARRKWELLDNLGENAENGYILFSKDKLKGLYLMRQYWCERNYCDLDLSEISSKNKLMYEENGIYVWKISSN